MNTISFEKFKAYLESQGYVEETKCNEFGHPLYMKEIFFSKEGEKDKYSVKVFMFSDKVASISYGHGSVYNGNIKNVKIDFRKKFWKKLSI